jgi:hypothetical protein
MLKKIIISTLFTFTFLVFFNSYTWQDTPPGSKTEAPGEGSCHSCHDNNTLNSGPGALNIEFNNNNSTNYTPGEKYPIKIVLNQDSAHLFGFQTVILKDSNDTGIGQITIIDANRTISYSGFGALSSRRYVAHKLAGTDSLRYGLSEWEYEWTAPATNVGSITLYAIGNASYGSDDYIYKTNLTLTPNLANTKNSISKNQFDFKIYPNPATEYLMIEVKNIENQNSYIVLKDLFGKKIKRIENIQNNSKTKIDVSGLPKGVYCAILFNGNKKGQKTFVVN